MQHNNPVIFVGGAHVDRCGWLDGPAQLDRSNPGRFETFPGGAALNVASVMATLGEKTRLHTILGNDAEAEFVLETCRKRGIATKPQRSNTKPTASYTSIVEANGALVIAVADMNIYDDFSSQSAAINTASRPDDWLCIDANLPAKEIAKIAAHYSGRVVGLTTSAAKAKRMRSALPFLSTLFTNRAELAALLELDSDTSINAQLEALSALGVEQAVVSDGANPITVLEKGEMYSLSVEPIDGLVDVTGAGDALAGATLFALKRGLSLQTSLTAGMAAAAQVVQTPGPLSSNTDFSHIIRSVTKAAP